jgi:hypothetical protein
MSVMSSDKYDDDVALGLYRLVNERLPKRNLPLEPVEAEVEVFGNGEYAEEEAERETDLERLLKRWKTEC